MAHANRRNLHMSGIDRMAQYLASNDFDAAVVEELEMRIKRTEESWLKFLEEHEQIVAITIATDVEAVSLNSDILVRTEEKYMTTVITLQRKI